MPQTVTIPGQGTAEFPDDMQTEDMLAVIRNQFPPQVQVDPATLSAVVKKATPKSALAGGTPPPKSGSTLNRTATETFAEHAGAAAVPGAAFAAAAPVGAAWGAAVPVVGETGISEFIGALVAGGIASWGAYKAQHALVKAVAPKFTEAMDRRLAEGEEDHPFAAIAGDVAGNLPSMELEAVKASQLAFRAALGATVGAIAPLAQGEKPSLKSAAEGAIMGTAFGKSRGWTEPPAIFMPRAAAAVKEIPSTKGAPDAVQERIDYINKSLADLEKLHGPRDTFNPKTQKAEPLRILTTTESRLLAELEKLQAQQSQAPGAQPQLSPEHQAELEKAATETGAEIRYEDMPEPTQAPPPEGDQPFARRSSNTIAYFDKATGQTVVNRQELAKWLAKNVPPGQEPKSIRKLLAHERIHGRVTDQQALDYYGTLSAGEILSGQRVYGGPGWESKPLSPRILGHEMLRMRIEQLKRGTVSETIERSLKERWTVKSLLAVNDAIRGIREAWGTTASKEGLAILDQIQGNLDAAIKASGAVMASNATITPPQEQYPGATRKAYHGTEHDVDEFKLEKIGTGEGSQVNGWGLYFAEEPKVAEKYRPYKEDMVEKFNRGGNLYTVELDADDSELLHYDKPFDQQPRTVQNMAMSLMSKDIQEAMDRDPWTTTRESAENHFKQSWTAAQMYYELGQREKAAHPMQIKNPDAAASKVLSLNGIKGVVYDDKFSRKDKTRTPTKNYVIFDPKHIRITERNGRAVSLDEAQRRQKSDASEPGSELKDKDADDFKALQAKFGALDPASPTFEKDYEDILAQMEVIKNRNKGYVPGTEPQEPGATRKDLEKGQGKLFLPPVAHGEDVQRPTLAEAKSATAPPVVVNTDRFAFEDPNGIKIPTPDLLSQPVRLGRVLTEGGKVSGPPTGKFNAKGEPIYQSFPERYSRAVVALEKDGEVHLVHAYRETQNLFAMLTDPAKGLHQRQHVELQELLKRGYKPIGGFLLKEPVYDFYEYAGSVDNYSKRLGDQAKLIAEHMKDYMEGRAIKGTESKTGKAFTPEEQSASEEGSMDDDLRQAVSGEEAPQVSRPLGYGEITEDRPGVLTGRVGPIHDSEATAIVDWLELPRSITPEHIEEKIKALAPTDRQVISAVRKLAAVIDRKYQSLTKDQLLGRVAQQIYDNHQNSKTLDEFVQRTIQQGPSRGILQAHQPPATGATARRLLSEQTGARELTVPAGARTPIPAGPAPEHIPPPPARVLTPEELAAVITHNKAWTGGTVESLPSKIRPMLPIGSIYDKLAGPAATAADQLAANDALRESRLATARAAIGKMRPKVPQVSPEGLSSPGFNPRQRARLMGQLEPGANRKIFDAANEERKLVEDDIRGFVAGRKTKDVILRSLAGAENAPNIIGAKAEMGIRLQSMEKPKAGISRLLKNWTRGNKEVLAAAKVLVQAQAITKDGQVLQTAKLKIPFFQKLVTDGLAKATKLSLSSNWREARLGKAQVRAGKEIMSELDYAAAHWDDPELQATAIKMKLTLDDEWLQERMAGIEVQKDPNYTPTRWDPSLWNEHSFIWPQATKILGEHFKQPKSYDTIYHAYRESQLIPVTNDGASLVGHRVRRGQQTMYRLAWREGLKAVPLASGSPLAVKAGTFPDGSPRSPQGFEQYEVNARLHLAIHPDFAPFVDSLTSPSAFKEGSVMSGAVHGAAILKHTMLVGDFFHLGRIMYYAHAIMGKSAGWRGGYSALDIADADLDRAVKVGIITPEDKAWGQGLIKYGDKQISRRAVLQKFYSAMGANLGKIQDALYKDLVTDMTPSTGPKVRGLKRLADPTVGRYNRMLFDKLTRGFMAEANVREFERQSAANPDANPDDLMRDIATDVNTFFGNLGRQGWFKSATARDLSQLVFIAPEWLQGLIKKELTAYSRLSGASSLAGQRSGLTRLGTTGIGMARGMIAMFAAVQAINLYTRHQFTWQNKEKGHGMDAFVPGFGADHNGYWLPMGGIFNELTEQLWSAAHTDPTLLQAADHIFGNKESPLMRAAILGIVGSTPGGLRYMSSEGQLEAAGSQLVPVPLTFGKVAQVAGHAVAPGLIHPPPAGTVGRQLFASAGIKVQPAQGLAGGMYEKARDFMAKQGLKPETGWQQVATDEPSYSKLRTAIRNGDEKESKKQLDALRKTKALRATQLGTSPDTLILGAMTAQARRPFTGSKAAEAAFIQTLSPDEIKEYAAARQQRADELKKFAEWLAKQKKD